MRLARTHQVIAPDLLGHGDSARPRGDYSIGAHAAAIRDLLAAIGVDRATIVGHSLGGGVAMQFFWQFPSRVDRKSTRLNSSHANISYAVFCLKKKKIIQFYISLPRAD